MGLDRSHIRSIFVLMLHGYSLSASLPEETGLGERFWYWRGISGQSYIHSIYPGDFHPPLAGAVYVLVRNTHGQRRALAVGRFEVDGSLPKVAVTAEKHDEIHVHLLAADKDAAEQVRWDLEAALTAASQDWPEKKAYQKPYQLELLAA